ncbi:MAG: hypothetical protein KC643_29510 [Nitrospira sp.]|nr:hypothetical protein [Nitrospira sp.]
MKNNLVSILVNGKAYGGWESVSITRSLENAAAGFQLAVSDRFPGQRQPLRIIPGDACQVRIDEDLVITGYVDQVNPSHDANSHSIAVTGRSKTADLIDCSDEPPWSSIHNQTILQIAHRMAQPFGVDIVDNLKDKTEPLSQFDSNPGDTVFSTISRLASRKGCLVTDDEKGRLLLTRAGSAKASTMLRTGQGGNILSGSATFDQSNRFKRYIVIGQGKGDDFNHGEAVAGIMAEAQDLGVKRNRPIVIRAEGTVDLKKAQDRARWEAAARVGKSLNLTLTVQGWRQENGDLWRVNHLVYVLDPILTVDGEFLIVSVNYVLGSQGTLTTLTLSPKAAYELIPSDPDPTKDIGVYEELREGIKSL